MQLHVEPNGAMYVGRKRGTLGDLIGWVRPAPRPETGWVAKTSEKDEDGEPTIEISEDEREWAIRTFLVYYESHYGGTT